MTEVIQHLRRIPRFREIPETRIQVERLGGLTNLVYRARVDDEDFLLRIPGRGTEEYIDRVAEKHDAQVAADAGVSARVLHFDEDSGVMLAEYIDGSTLNAERFRDQGSVRRSAEALRELHGSGASFKRRFEVFDQIDEYLGLIDRMQARVPAGYEAVREEAGHVRRILQSRNVMLAPCHCDPLAENFIDTGTRVFIVDWEYAGNNDPMWDLGDLSVEAQFDEDQDRVLLESYFGGEPPADQAGRMVVYKMLCDLLWTLWGVVQHANGNPADDFWSYSVNRFDRCQRLMQDPVFARAVAAL
jgi:thiamine kinase-like enzyme